MLSISSNICVFRKKTVILQMEMYCYIPNKEVGDEMVNAVNATGWTIQPMPLYSKKLL